MEQRRNAGYKITDMIHVGACEFVLGENENAPGRFVTWRCRDGDDYSLGHYFTDKDDAVKDLVKRASDEIKFREHMKPRTRGRSR